MNERNKKILMYGSIALLGMLLVFGVARSFLTESTVEVESPNDRIVVPDPSSEGITNFEECIAAGNPVKGSYPRQCTTVDGKNFREDIDDTQRGLCIVTGCSSQLCEEETVVSSCEFKEEYACYREALCERQADGQCGWTMTNDLAACLDQAAIDGTPIPQPDVVKEVESSQKEVIIEKSGADIVIKERLIAWGYESATNRSIDTVILHSSYNSLGGDEYDVEAIIDIYKQYSVGAHYIIDRDGIIYQLVKDKNIAYHAGVSSLPDGRTNVNQISIGIEVVNTKEDEFTPDQYRAINALLAELEKTYTLKYVLGHDDIAPDRKTDPWNIDWSRIRNDE